MHFLLQLKHQDLSALFEFPLRYLKRMQLDKYWPSRILRTDEPHFHLDGDINTQNCPTWGYTSGHAVHEEPLHYPYATVQCVFTSNFIFGPYSFEKVTMNGFVMFAITRDRYRRLLKNHVAPSLRANSLPQCSCKM